MHNSLQKYEKLKQRKFFDINMNYYECNKKEINQFVCSAESEKNPNSLKSSIQIYADSSFADDFHLTLRT